MNALTLSSGAAPSRGMPPIATMLLIVAMLSTGAAGLIIQYVLATVSTYVLGNSIEQFSLVIATMLLSMGIAAFLQRFVGNDYLIEKFVMVEVALALLGGFAPLIIYSAYSVFDAGFMIVLYGTVAMIGFLIGFEIPIVIRINERYVGTLPANLGWILSADFIGSFVGAIIWIKVLLVTFPLTEISFLASGFNFTVALVTVMYFTKVGALTKKRLVAAILLTTAALLTYGWMQNGNWSLSVEQKLYDSPIVHAQTTKYQRIVMTEDSATGDQRLYLNGGLQFSSSDEAIYHEHLVHPAMALASSRTRVLILGGGDGLALREVLKYRDVREVLLVDIDPAMLALAATNPKLRKLNHDAFKDARVSGTASSAVTGDGFRAVYVEDDSEQGAPPSKEKVATVSVLNVDAYKFVSEVGYGPWDVIIIDFPDPDQVELAKLYSREFYGRLSKSLAPDGIMTVQSTSPYHAKEAFLCVGRTIVAAGLNAVPYHANVPSFGDWGWYLASGSRSASELQEALKRLPPFPVETRYLSPDLVRASLAFGKGQLDARYAEVNSLMQPVLLFYYTNHAWQQS